MPRPPRIDVGGYIYHIINRATARAQIFFNEEDYLLFESVLEQAQAKFGMRILSYCIMPNHWHLILFPVKDGEISKFMKWLAGTHTQRWHAMHKTAGAGHIYQGRYKSFLVDKDTYLLQLLRYIERNPLRGHLVRKAEKWRWSSLWVRIYGSTEQQKILSPLPIDLPKNYIFWINKKEPDEIIGVIKRSIKRNSPLGGKQWTRKIVKIFKLQSTFRREGRPKNGT